MSYQYHLLELFVIYKFYIFSKLARRFPGIKEKVLNKRVLQQSDIISNIANEDFKGWNDPDDLERQSHKSGETQKNCITDRVVCEWKSTHCLISIRLFTYFQFIPNSLEKGQFNYTVWMIILYSLLS